MVNKKLIKLTELLQEYNQWKFCGKDRDIIYLVADINATLKKI